VTCQDDVLSAFARLMARPSRDTFSLGEITREVRSQGSSYRESTIRTNVTSRMCANARDHHAIVYDDLERVGRGLYRLSSDRSR
jgi:hypothetical protein